MRPCKRLECREEDASSVNICRRRFQSSPCTKRSISTSLRYTQSLHFHQSPKDTRAHHTPTHTIPELWPCERSRHSHSWVLEATAEERRWAQRHQDGGEPLRLCLLHGGRPRYLHSLQFRKCAPHLLTAASMCPAKLASRKFQLLVQGCQSDCHVRCH